MSLENLDVKNIYVIGENLKSKIGQELDSQFSGQKLVSWLLDNDGQVSTREEGVKLGKHLVEYRVIQHIDEKYHFLDDPTRIYSFCSDNHDYPRTVSQRQIWVQGLSIMRQFAQDIAGAKKRRTSWINFNKGSQSNPNFKGKHLLEWLENNTDFESREDCKRFLKSLLKLNFLRCNQNDLRFDPSSEYWFYLTKLKEDLSKTRKISKTLMPEGRKQSVQEKTLTRKQSIIGLTPDFIDQLTSFQSCTGSGAAPRVDRIKLKDTCVVLRSSLSRTSLNISRTSLSVSQSSLTQSSVSLSHRCQSSSALPTNYLTQSTTSLPAEVRADGGGGGGGGGGRGGGERASFCDQDKENRELNTQSYIMRLKEQYSAHSPRQRSTQSESQNDPTVSDLIESQDFQKRLQNIGKSSSTKNLKQVEEDRRAILYQLTERKYGRVINEVMSPSSSCPNNLDSLLKRDYSTESHATKSSGYSSSRGKCYSATSLSSGNLSVSGGESVSSSRDSICSTPTSQNDQPVSHSGTLGLEASQQRSTESRDSDTKSISDKGSCCSDKGSCGSDKEGGDPVPPPRRSLEREPLKTESDNEISVSRLMSSGAMNMQTAHSARRARLTRTRAVSDGDAKTT